MLLAVGLAALDAASPFLQLRPIAYGFVIAVAALAGFRWGLISAIAVAVAFTIAETLSGFQASPKAAPWNMLIAAPSFIAVAYIVELVRARSLSATTARSDLASAEAALETTRRLHDAQIALHESEKLYAAIADTLPFGTWELNADGTEAMHMSANYCALFGMTPHEIMHEGWRQRVNPQDAERFLAAWNARSPSEVFESEYRVHAVDGKTYWILSRGVALTDADGAVTGWAGFSLDITEHKRSETRLTMLSDLGRVLSLSLEPKATLDRAARVIVPRLADWCAVDLVDREGNMQRALFLHGYDDAMNIVRRLSDADQRRLIFGRTAVRVVATKTPQLRQSVQPGPEGGQPLNPDEQAIVGRLWPTSLIAVPLVVRDKTLGAMMIASKEGEEHYSKDDLDFAVIIARRVALALDNALLYERELRVADMFQRASLPASLPNIPGIAIHAHYQPGAREAEIGGDWYDAFQLSDGRVGVSIGDVAGKGLQAAATMSAVRLLIRATALEGSTPSRVLARANELLLNDRPTMVTAVFGILDPEEMTFTCSIAGHPPPIVVSADGDVATGSPSAPPLGIMGDAEYAQQSLMVPLGSMLVLYTDGLVESKKARQQGDAGLFESVRAVAASSVANPAESIAARLVDPSPLDDVAVLTISAAAKPLLELDLTLPAQPVSGRVFRQALRRFYLAAGLHEDKIELFQVAMGEAITNSIQHAYGIQGGAVRVHGRVEFGKLIVEVHDTGSWRGPHDDGGGYGLQILKSLVQDVTIDAGQFGTTVRLSQPIGRSIT